MLKIGCPNPRQGSPSRGLGRRNIFHSDKDYETFLAKLVENAEDFRVKIRSYYLMLQYLLAKYCRGRYSLVEISEHLGISVGGLSSARTRMKRALKQKRNAGLRQQQNALEAGLNRK